ncbi:MAG: DedA family protein [Gammaproteobacteria bacterium]|nr:DedA family protein [Gammaproteobacteria bacterium]
MELLQFFIDFILNLDTHLVELLRQYGLWLYAILFVIVFAETGLVVTPWLPGDSLLFAVGTLAAIDTSGTLHAPTVAALLIVAAILGNSCNYAIGKAIGPPAFSGRYRLLKIEYLRQTEAYFVKHGGKTVVISRFLPLLRTFAPFVAGIARMQYSRFQMYNVLGALSWVTIFLGGGYLFGNIPIVRDNFGLVTLTIIFGSLIPVAIVTLRRRRS